MGIMDKVDGREEFSKAGMFGTTAFALVLGIVLWILFFLRPVEALVKARHWAPTSCEVLSSKLVSELSHGKDSVTTYGIAISYRWAQGGATYTGSRYDFYGWLSNVTGDDDADIVRSLPLGARVTCYVDPNDPREAVIDRNVHGLQIFAWAMAWLLLGAGFFVLSLTVRFYRKVLAARRALLEESGTSEA
jgi:hypothetical protein